MISTLQIVLLVVAGFFGTALSMLLGWSESADLWDLKKAVSSLIRGFIAALIFIVGSYASAVEIQVWDYIVVAIFSAGFEVITKRTQAIATR